MVWMEKAERRTWRSRTLLLAIVPCALFVAQSSCSDGRLIGTAGVPEGGTFSPLAPIDASDSDAEAGLIAYCPSSQCPPGWMTCPDSRFPCDTNILAEARNCGGCGMACPTKGAGGERFVCNEGTCTMECSATAGDRKDCDGLVDNGCESGLFDPLNCGACGVVCAVGESCHYQDAKRTKVGCGCPPGTVDCQVCTDVSADDDNCGACNHTCDRTGGPGAPQYLNTYYGCGSGQCGNLKCKPGFANCDGDIENGCEASTSTDDNCGYCGNKCGAGQKCGVNEASGELSCLCAEGRTFCQTGEKDGLPVGRCADVISDTLNCGACGVSCGGANLNEMPICDYGRCVFRCRNGAADCNGSRTDGCEIDTRSDPRNCGGCGITCDLTMGQACVAGKCVVEPCDQADAGEVTR
ncbi:MAG: hypothetical protein BGO98_34005 [Myxococcales bacterium 68-20]|nr:MAG: hypothetical protein BGO98_34005 [Myxococcales bacterium 68-20]